MKRQCIHFTEIAWADFARGLGTAAQRLAMQAHLDSGCQPCVGIFRKLCDVFRVGQMAEAPLEVVERAIAIFPHAADRGWLERLETVVAELVSNTQLEWRPAGVRSMALDVQVGGERRLYRAGGYWIDLNLDPPKPIGAGELVGQISADGDDQRESFDGALVQLVIAGRTREETPANRFGEFVLPLPKGKAATLRIALKDAGRLIELPLQTGRQNRKR
ncbi:MAG: hypothetical protein R2762_14450 [Bryobacteraceae bacterium]